MARPANPNKEKIAELKTQMKENSKLVRQGETAASKNEKLAARLAKLSGDEPVAAKKTAKPTKEKEKSSSKDKVSKKDKKESSKDKAKLQVVKKRGRPKKNADEDEG